MTASSSSHCAVRSCSVLGEAKARRLSVVFPNYNHARYVGIQLNSMLSQSRLPDEIIIVDDASTDSSVDVIEGYCRQHEIIRLIRNEANRGVEVNINRLLWMASGDYIYLSASDDIVLPGFFEQAMAILERYPKAGMCSGIGTLIGEDGSHRGIRSLPVVSMRPCFMPPDEVARRLRKFGRWVAVSSMILRREALIAEGGQDTDAGSFADNLSALVIALRHGACFVPTPFSAWRQMATGHGTASGSDWVAQDAMGRKVVGLMRGKYRGLFREDFVRPFERHWRYMVSEVAWRQARREGVHVLETAWPAIRSTYATEALTRIAVVTRMSVLSRLLWRGYHMIRFGPLRWWLLGRLSILVNTRRIVIREMLEV